MDDPTLAGTLQHVLVPRTFGRHNTGTAEFIILSVEIWTTGLVVNMQVRSAAGPQFRRPGIVVEDHLGTVYTRKGSVSLGARHLQYFEPSVPEGIRTLTIKCEDSEGIHQVLFVAVPSPRGMKGGRLKVRNMARPAIGTDTEQEAS
ncbi:hypothetical protein [Arthrobacter mobilis]|uniref:Uncharacterized protein n=1 Tax=Arthrobacter mobilis TaxID=2724944 RepID=A0A7X6HD41_9MICC|nr:hypothetical protein [Arthrobacter mobilis]NKX53928.1 hypothetical protein [Arthrobacter mobilis]